MNIFSVKMTTRAKGNLYRLSQGFDKIEDLVQSKKSLRYSCISLLVVLFAGIIFFLNLKTPMISDDYVYSFIYNTSQPIKNFNDIILSQKIHYYEWGGRSVVHFIAQTLLLLNNKLNNKLIVDFLNTGVFIAFIFLICFHVKGKKVLSIPLFLIAFLATWFLQPTFAETILWITGSANYLWGTSIILLFLIPYRRYEGNLRSKSLEIVRAGLMFLGGFIAGWCTENTGAAMIVIIVLFIFYYKANKWRLPAWVFLGLVGAVIGYIIMISAPGNLERAKGTSCGPFLIFYRILTDTQSFVYYLGCLNLMISILLGIYIKYTHKERIKNLQLAFIYSVGVLCAIYSMILAPGFPPRAWFGAITLNIIVLGIILSNLNYSYALIRNIRRAILLWGIIAFAFSLYDATVELNRIDKLRKERDLVIAQKIKEGAKSVEFERIGTNSKFALGDPTHVKKHMSLYYGFEFNFK